MINLDLVFHRFHLVIALFFVTAIAGCGKTATLPEVTLERARILMERGQAAEAIPLLDDAILKMPNRAEARFQRGLAYESLSVLEKALADYSECLRLDPERTDALNNKAVILARMKRLDEAAVEFGRLIDLDPQAALFYRNRGLCQFDLGNHDAALADYAKALELAPKDPAGWFQRGGVYLKQGRFAEAEQDYSKAIDLNPELAKAWMNRGVSRYKRGEKKLAAEDLEKAQSLDDNIVLPDIDFFSEHVSSGKTAETDSASLWPIARSFAEEALAAHDFTSVSLVREFPSMLCAEFKANVDGNPRRILVTCSAEGQAYLTLPSDPSAAADCALLVIRLPREAGKLPVVSRFEEHWTPL
jgi:tetratricopeptide (TPR) repeat protein